MSHAHRQAARRCWHGFQTEPWTFDKPYVNEVYISQLPTNTESPKSSRRMAAAPELVEALEAVKIPYGCWCYQGYFHPHQPQCLKAQAAIAKARGE